MTPTKGRIVYVAFPGMGKTTYAKNHHGVVDLDFGFFRESIQRTFPGQKPSPVKLGVINAAFLRLCKYYASQGWIILTNEPALIPGLKQTGFQVIVEVPSDVDDLVKRVTLRDGPQNAFVQLLQRNAHEWVSSWETTAKKYQLPLVKGKYFKEVKMPYEEETN